MPANIEIKARVDDADRLEARVAAMADGPCETIVQEDTFYAIERGRLKLRTLSPEKGELIYYERIDSAGPKRSDYLIARTADPDSLETVLAAALGVRGVVRKRRRLYMVGQTRVHLDEVDGLGSWMELEVVLEKGQSSDDGAAIAAGLMHELGITDSDLVEGAYIDLIERQRV